MTAPGVRTGPCEQPPRRGHALRPVLLPPGLPSVPSHRLCFGVLHTLPGSASASPSSSANNSRQAGPPNSPEAHVLIWHPAPGPEVPAPSSSTAAAPESPRPAPLPPRLRSPPRGQGDGTPPAGGRAAPEMFPRSWKPVVLSGLLPSFDLERAKPPFGPDFLPPERLLSDDQHMHTYRSQGPF